MTAVRGFALRLLAIAALLAAPAAHAVEYQRVVPQQSAVTFTFEQMGVAIDGRFKRFAATLRFDPARPEQARAAIEIDLTSVDAGSTEADEEAAGRLWFDSRTHPRARFVAKSVRATGAQSYLLNGTLTIKGRSRDIAVPVRFTPGKTAATFDGSFVIKRLDFGIGEGMWSDVEAVANEVKVRFRIVARP